MASPVAIVGGLPDQKSTAIWYISDGVTDEPLFQGVAPLNAADRTYGFILDLQPGRYNLTVETLLAGQAYGQETVNRSGSGSRGALCQTSRGGPTGVRPLEVIQAWTSS